MRSLQLSILRVVFAGLCRSLSLMWLATVCLLLLISTASAQTPSTITPDNLAYDVKIALEYIADTATVEHVVCILAVPTGGRETVGDSTEPILDLAIYITPPQSTDAHKATFAPCPWGTIAQWHNHILASTVNALKSLAISPPKDVKGPWQACVLSLKDYDETRRALAKFVMISVREGVSCWWSKDEVRLLPRALVNWPQHVVSGL